MSLLNSQNEGDDQQQTNNDPDDSGNLLQPGPADFLKEKSFDKFRNESGEVDVVKLAKSYSGLEKKLGSGDLPPETVDGYGFPEGVEETGLTKDNLKEFLQKAHESGMTDKQVKMAVSELAGFVKRGKEVQESGKKSVEDTLKEQWGVKYDENIQNAQKAFARFADDEDKANSGDIASNPKVMKLLAKLGAGLREDSPVNNAAQMPKEDLQSLMKSEAYWDPKHPEHAKVKKAVTDHFSNKG